MSENRPLVGLCQKLTELNKLEDDGTVMLRRVYTPSERTILIASLRSGISANVLLQHDRLRARGRNSVAEVKNNVCSGCHMNLASGIRMEVQRQSDLVKCDHCSRFLFLTPEEATHENR